MTQKVKAMAAAVKAAGIDTKRDYFTLSAFEKSTLDDIRREYGYTYRNPTLTRLQTFYFAVQKVNQ